jgi:hypothetical protein
MLDDKLSRLAGNVAWLMPQCDPDRLDFHNFTSSSPNQLRMVPLTCNDPATIAYSACWNWSILHLHAHTAEESLVFYHDVAARTKEPLWLYIPQDEGEQITQIWKRSRALTRELALLVS